MRDGRVKWLVGLAVLIAAGAGIAIWGSGQTEGPESNEVDRRPLVAVTVLDEKGEGLAGVAVADQLTDASGRCEIRIASGEATTVAVRKSGYCPAKMRVDALDEATSIERWVRLERGRRIRVAVVIAGTNQPASGARVEMNVAMGPVGATYSRVETADSNGRARFDHVPSCVARFRAIPKGFTSEAHYCQVVQDRQTELITLYATRTTHVVVRLVNTEGKVVRGASVQTGRRLPEVSVCEDGTFETDVAAGDVCKIEAFTTDWAYGAIEFTGDGRQDRDERIVLGPAEEHPERHRLSLSVIDKETGSGVPDAHITLDFTSPLGLERSSTKSLGMDLRTDAKGRLDIRAIPLRQVTVFVERTRAISERSRSGPVVEGIDGVLEATVRLRSEKPVITCRPSRPVAISVSTSEIAPPRSELFKRDRWEEIDGAPTRNGVYEIVPGWDRQDIFYRPHTDISREMVARDIPAGSRDVVLPLYETGDLLVVCDSGGSAVPRAMIALEGADFADSVWKEDARGRLFVRDVPIGSHKLWLWAFGYEAVGPFDCTIEAGRRTEVKATFAEPLPKLAVDVQLDNGAPLPWCKVWLWEEDGETKVPLLDERFGEVLLATTLSDGKCFIPVPAGKYVVALQGSESVRRTKYWNRPVEAFCHRTVTVTGKGVARYSVRAAWKVFIAEVAPGSPGEAAGAARGDVIASWNGTPVRDVKDCMSSEAATVTVMRKGNAVELKLPKGKAGLEIERLYFER